MFCKVIVYTLGKPFRLDRLRSWGLDPEALEVRSEGRARRVHCCALFVEHCWRLEHQGQAAPRDAMRDGVAFLLARDDRCARAESWAQALEGFDPLRFASLPTDPGLHEALRASLSDSRRSRS